jgi:hypothetical protein
LNIACPNEIGVPAYDDGKQCHQNRLDRKEHLCWR